MTTNVGAAELSRCHRFWPGDQEEGRKKLPSARLSHRNFATVDGIISFNPLPQTVMIKITDKFLKELAKKLKETLTMEVTDAAREYLARKGYDPAYGARPNRCIEDNVKKPLSEELLFGSLSREGRSQSIMTTTKNHWYFCLTAQKNKKDMRCSG